MDATKKDAELIPAVETSLNRLAEGIPLMELQAIVSEAKQCEDQLQTELDLLRKALQQEQQQNNKTSSSSLTTQEEEETVNAMLESEITPPDSCFTVSALLGRLREELATPLPPNSTLPELRAKAGLTSNQPPAKRRKSSTGGAVDMQLSFAELHKLEQYEWYRKHHDTHASLLSLWKRIANHRTSIVFRRPVNPKEAPGYTERITFPMDLSLIRKMIVARMITSYAELHTQIGLICHACLKYNGRESDYGLVTRDFEAVVDDMIVAAVAAKSKGGSGAGAGGDASSRPSSSLSVVDTTAAAPDNNAADSSAAVAPAAAPASASPSETKPTNEPTPGK
jgi:hypothetical protein